MDQPTIRNTKMPRTIANSCLFASAGLMEARAAMPMVQRKNATVSTSKALRRMIP